MQFLVQKNAKRFLRKQSTFLCSNICVLCYSIKKRPYSIIITEKDTIHKKLKDASQIRVDTVTRIKKDLIIKEIDVLDDETFKRVLQTLNSIFC